MEDIEITTKLSLQGITEDVIYSIIKKDAMAFSIDNMYSKYHGESILPHDKTTELISKLFDLKERGYILQKKEKAIITLKWTFHRFLESPKANLVYWVGASIIAIIAIIIAIPKNEKSESKLKLQQIKSKKSPDSLLLNVDSFSLNIPYKKIK